MGVPWLCILPVMIAVRQQDSDLGPHDVIKVARMAVGDSDAVISFSGDAYDRTAFFTSGTWTALPVPLHNGDLTIEGPLFRIIKLLKSRDIPISCPVQWANFGWEVYLCVTKPKQKVADAFTVVR
eukprot:s1961_g16.t1